jgi:hypothetical protein
VIEHVWSVLCGKASIDRETNNVSLFDIIEQIQIEALQPLPAEGNVLIPFTCELVSLWSRADPDVAAQGFARVTFQEHGREAEWGAQAPVIGNELPLDLLGDSKRLRTRIQIPGFPVRHGGYYFIAVEFRSADDPTWHLVTRVPLEVTISISD